MDSNFTSYFYIIIPANCPKIKGATTVAFSRSTELSAVFPNKTSHLFSSQFLPPQPSYFHASFTAEEIMMTVDSPTPCTPMLIHTYTHALLKSTPTHAQKLKNSTSHTRKQTHPVIDAPPQMHPQTLCSLAGNKHSVNMS